jgi:hypothetical protein
VRGFLIAKAGANRVLAGDLVSDYLTRPDLAAITGTIDPDTAARNLARELRTMPTS